MFLEKKASSEVLSLHDLAEREVLRYIRRMRGCQSARCVLTEAPWSGPGPQIQSTCRYGPRNVSLKVRGGGTKKWRERERERKRGEGCSERCYHFPSPPLWLVWRESLKTDDLHLHWDRLQQRGLPGFRKDRVKNGEAQKKRKKKKKKNRERTSGEEMYTERRGNRQTSSLTRQTWGGRDAGTQKETGKVSMVILFDFSSLPSGAVT